MSWLRAFHVHWYHRRWETYGYVYTMCRCGKRAARRKIGSEGHTPYASWWVEGSGGPPVRPLPPVSKLER